MKPFRKISREEAGIRAGVAEDPQLLAAGAAMAQGMPASSAQVADEAQAASPMQGASASPLIPSVVSAAVATTLAPAQGSPQPNLELLSGAKPDTLAPAQVNPAPALAPAQGLPATALAPAQGLPATVLAPAQGPVYAVGMVVDVPTSEVIENPWNARRTPPTRATIEKRVKSLQEKGQLIAAMGYVGKDGRVHLYDGHVRLTSLKIAGIPTIRIELQEPPIDDKDLYLKSRAANMERGSQNPLDDALAWHKLLEDNVFPSQAELARSVGCNTSHMSRVLNLVNLPEAVVEMLYSRPELLENLRMLDSLRLFCEAFGEPATEAMVLEVERDGLAARDVDARRVNRQREKVKRERSEISTQKYVKGHATVRQFEVGRKVVVDIENVDDAVQLERLAEAIRVAVASVLG